MYYSFGALKKYIQLLLFYEKKLYFQKNALHSLFWCFALCALPGRSWSQALLVNDFTGTTGSALTVNGWTKTHLVHREQLNYN
jgi:hypothetical protein